MAGYNPITKLTSRNESFDLGANFNNIYYSDENDYSLMDFFAHMKSFLESDMFMIYSKEEPSKDHDNIKIWYDTNITPM